MSGLHLEIGQEIVPQPFSRAIVYYNLPDLLFLKRLFRHFQEESSQEESSQEESSQVVVKRFPQS